MTDEYTPVEPSPQFQLATHNLPVGTSYPVMHEATDTAFPGAAQYIKDNFPVPELLDHPGIYLAGGSVLWALQRALNFTEAPAPKDWDLFCENIQTLERCTQTLCSTGEPQSTADCSRPRSLLFVFEGASPVDFVQEVIGPPALVVRNFDLDISQVYYSQGKIWGTSAALYGIKTSRAMALRSLPWQRADRIRAKGFELLEPYARVPHDAKERCPRAYNNFRFGRTTEKDWEVFERSLKLLPSGTSIPLFSPSFISEEVRKQYVASAGIDIKDVLGKNLL